MITIKDSEFRKLCKYIELNYGINLKNKNKSFVIARLSKILINNNFRDFSQYYDYLLSNRTGEAVRKLIERITTNHTYFMREAEHFEYFKNKVLPILKETVKDRDLRIWCAGCSSGEEPYTLAMIIDSFLANQKKFWDTRILATDISDKVLDTARKGIYKKESVALLPAEYRLRYFQKVDNNTLILGEQIKNEVIFRKLNLVDEKFPFRRTFHVIFCRNVMIYFDIETKKKLVRKLYEATDHGGYLFIGHSEFLSRGDSGYKGIKPAVYRKE